ncbi:hypothetical protein T492DRAFT_623806, partial [Pavlovales sp. CCMP2436]
AASGHSRATSELRVQRRYREPAHDAQAHAQRRAAVRVRRARCEYSATQPGHLARHKRTHSGARAHACDEPGCEYRATTASHLTTHKRTHSGERPYSCDDPGCEYRHSGGQPREAQAHAQRRAAIPVRRAGLQVQTTHKRTHSGERPFPCDEPGCRYSAAHASSLTTHKRTHSGKRPFPCDEPGCEYRAAEEGHLTAHKRTHSGERSFACDGCRRPVVCCRNGERITIQ